MAMSNEVLLNFLKNKAQWVKRETFNIHRIAQETRLASSLSVVEIFTVLYYGRVLQFNPKNISWYKRDRFIVSKGHGAVSLYPILADLGFFSKSKLDNVCKQGSLLGGIPDPAVAGFETVNGSLGHGLGVACGMALALKRKKRKEKVFVLLGDGELYEGSVWEAFMFASHHRLDNLIAIIDYNKICMLDYCKNIINMEPLAQKFKAFGWQVMSVDGHDIRGLYNSFKKLKNAIGRPKVLIADTVKGKGALPLENNPLCHIRNLNKQEIDDAILRLG